MHDYTVTLYTHSSRHCDCIILYNSTAYYIFIYLFNSPCTYLHIVAENPQQRNYQLLRARINKLQQYTY
jgi:hypothetical protein